VKVIFADDHNLIRETIGVLLQDLSKDVEILEAEDFKGAMKHATTDSAPDLIILDLYMPGMNHLEGLRTMKEKFPSIPVVILTGSVDMNDAKSSLDQGAAGYIPKNIGARVMIDALKLIMSGEKYLPTMLVAEAEKQESATIVAGANAKSEKTLEKLTPREREVLGLLTKGYPNKEIARKLELREITVKVHLKNVYRKLGVSNRTQAVRKLMEMGVGPKAPRKRTRKSGGSGGQGSGGQGSGSKGSSSAKSTGTSSTGPVTVLFTDIVGSTEMTQRFGDAGAQQVLRAHNEIVRDCLNELNGTEVKHTSDGIMAYFSATTIGVEASIVIQREIAKYNEEHPDLPLHVKIGLNTGEPIAEENDLFGATVQLTARIVEKAKADQILASETVRGICTGKPFIFRGTGSVSMKGFYHDIPLYEIVWAECRKKETGKDRLVTERRTYSYAAAEATL
jgi:two-component system nitrate/nitrite response regulator NarL